MVDPVGNKASVTAPRPVAPVGPGPRAAAPAEESAIAESAALATRAALAATPPVDAERVARIKRAIEEGRFPILPATIADRLLALKLAWNPNDPA